MIINSGNLLKLSFLFRFHDFLLYFSDGLFSLQTVNLNKLLFNSVLLACGSPVFHSHVKDILLFTNIVNTCDCYS